MKDELESGPTAGGSVLVAQHGKIIAAKGFGYADLKKKVPATEHTVYRLGSLSKQFTVCAVLQLVEKGQIDLDTSIRTYLTDYPDTGQPITPRHLLNHTSGLVSYTSQSEYWAHMRDEIPRGDVLKWFAERPLTFEPGSRYVYSNSGYFLLGLIVEKVTGDMFQDVIRRSIFEPLQLSETVYDNGERKVENKALGYARDSDGIVPARELNIELAFSVGGLASSVLDLFTFHEALRAGKLMPKSYYEMMTSPARLADGTDSEYGMGFHVNNWGGHRVFRHGGLIFGFKSCYYYYPQEDLTIIILMNTEQAEYRPIQSVIARLFIPDLPSNADTE